MKEQITVDKAIKRGHLIVNVPVIIALIGCPAFAIYFSILHLIPAWGIGIGFLIGFALSWLIWSFMITKWKIWAFENVRNVHDLKKRAIQENLIWNDGGIFEKTEIRNNADKIKLKKLESKFERKDEYDEDYSLPFQMEVFYSKVVNYMQLGISVLILGGGIYSLIQGETLGYILGIIMVAIGLYGTIKQSQIALDNRPEIIIDNKGIKIKNSDFKAWSSIKNEEAIQKGYGKHTRSYLTFFYDDEYEKIDISTLNVTLREMENILRTYRIRNNKTATNTR